MNEGYLFIIICWIVILLLWSEWLDGMWRYYAAEHKAVKRKRALFCVVIVAAGSFWHIPVTDEVQVNVGAFLVPFLLFVYHMWRKRDRYRVQMLCVVCFLAVLFAFAYKMFVLDPILMIIPAKYMVPILFALVITFTTHSLYRQHVMMLGGFLLGEVVHQYFLSISTYAASHIVIGDAFFRDQLATGFVIVTALMYVFLIFRKAYLWMMSFSRRLWREFRTERKQEG